VLTQVVRGASRIMGSARCSIWLPTHDGGLICTSAVGDTGYAAVQGRVLPPDLVARFSPRSAPFVTTPEESALIARAVSLEAAAATHAIVFVPLDQGLAMLAVVAESAVRSRELELLAGIASQARLAITNAGSFATLERTFLSTVEALANALEAKDSYTSSHARWICDTAIDVGRALGLDAVRLKRIELGALFHDIGKIGIPASILMKPGPLTMEERAMIERHPELGERILAPIDQLEAVRPIVRACHERFDGLGYPDGLKGEEIPLEARIIFACDAFHAMTTDRPYREALPVDEAFRRLVSAGGTQFDPEVVQVCLRVLKQPPRTES
jgi:HD-GYP domain-containing protein (c-di-GMP phosphodiesterase class II)